MHAETSVCVCVFFLFFFDFQNILRITKTFRNRWDFFQILLSTIFYERSGTFNEILSWSSLAWNIFSKIWFLFSDKSQVQKSGDVITCFLKNKTSEGSRLIVWNPLTTFFQCYLSLGVWCVFDECFVYLHHFYQYYLCFTARTLWKVNFWYQGTIQYNTDSCCE